MREPGVLSRYLKGAGIPELIALVVAVGGLVGFLWFFLTNFSVAGVVLGEVEEVVKTVWGWVSGAAGWLGGGVADGWNWITGD